MRRGTRTCSRILAGVLLATACSDASPGSPPVTISQTDVPRWYEGLQFRVEDSRSGDAFLFWPHEGVTIDSFRFVTRANVEALVHEDGGFAWQVARLEVPDVTIAVRLARVPDGLAVTYELRNGSSRPCPVMVGPCLQLPERFSAGVREADRADFVAVPTAERGWQRISATHRTPGVRDPSQRAVPRPWTQHYFSLRGHDHAATPHDANPGLNLFGVAEEHVTAGVIVALQPGGRRAVAVATDHEAGVTFALLDCLHAVIQAEVPAHGATRVAYRVLFHEGTFAELLATLRRDLPLLELPPDGSLPDPSEPPRAARWTRLVATRYGGGVRPPSRQRQDLVRSYGLIRGRVVAGRSTRGVPHPALVVPSGSGLPAPPPRIRPRSWAAGRASRGSRQEWSLDPRS